MKRDDDGQSSHTVSLNDVFKVFEHVEGPVVASSDVATLTGCSRETARRKLSKLYDEGCLNRRRVSGRILYWRQDTTNPNPVNVDEPFFSDLPTRASRMENLSERVDEIHYGEDT